MNRDYFKDIYKDFFQVENNNLNKKQNILNNESELDYEKKYQDIIHKFDDLYLDNDSCNLLKNIIEYMRKYHEGLEKNYIPFRLIINSNSNTLEIKNLIKEATIMFKYLNNLSYKEISFYKYDKSYEFKDNFLVFKNLSGIKLEETKEQQKFFNNLDNYLINNRDNIVIFEGSKDEVDDFFLGYENIRHNYFDLEINVINPTHLDIYNKVISQVSIDNQLYSSIFTYIENTYNKNLDYDSYIKDLVSYISFNKKVPDFKKNKSLDEIFKELNELVGLCDVKNVLYSLVDVLKLKEKSEGILNIKQMNLHMVFLGNPGTGKTTIARLLAGIFYELGIIKENKLVEVGVKDLVAEYVGQTAPKTNMVIEKSLNGVLFIDEAYALATTNNNSYNAEAIATLIQAMENYRDKLIVIFAGYTKEMQDFLNSNSGIVSRIGYTLNFSDYTTDELLKIFIGMTNKAGFIVEDNAISYLKEIIDKNRDMKNFGNARFIRNIYEKTVIKHATRVKDKKQSKILRTITKDDISIENLNLLK